MFVALVTGSIVATQKTSTMTGHKLLIVEPYRLDEKKRSKLVSTGRTFIAVASLGAGEGTFVLVTQGSSARMTPETKTLPIDAVIIGLVDTIQVEGKEVFSRDTADIQAD